MSWDAMIAAEVSALAHPDASWAFESWKLTRSYAYYGPAVRTAFVAGAEWVLKRQMEWPNLTEAEAIHELRLGVQSVFYPRFAADPRIFADCPRDGRVTTGADGICDHCLFDFAKE
jgi:hypothetical protein